MDSVFTRIVRREIPAAIVYEDEHTIAFMDAGQVNPGHVIVATRRQVETVLDLDDELAGALFRTAARVARAVDRAFHPAGRLADGAARAHSRAAAARGRRGRIDMAAQGAVDGRAARAGPADRGALIPFVRHVRYYLAFRLQDADVARPSPPRKAILATRDSVYYQLWVLSNLTARPFPKFGARFEMNLTGWRMMVTIADRPGISAQELSDYSGLDKMSVSRAVRSLEDLSLIHI